MLFLLTVVGGIALLEIYDVNETVASLMTGLLAGLIASLLTFVILSLSFKPARRGFVAELKSSHYSLMHLLILHHLTFEPDDAGFEQFTDFNNDCYNFIRKKMDSDRSLIYSTNDKTFNAVLAGIKGVQLQIPLLVGAYQYSFNDHLGSNFNNDLAKLRLKLHALSPDILQPKTQKFFKNIGVTFDYPNKLLGDYCKELFKFVDEHG